MAEYDLTKTIIPYLDRHLAFPLLAHLSETELFPVDQVRAAQYELAKGTNMVDYSVSLFEQLHPDQEIPKGNSSASLIERSFTFPKNLRQNVKTLSRQMKDFSMKHRLS